MATLEEAVFTLLDRNAAIKAIFAEAIYAEISPQDTEYPRLVFISDTEESIRTTAGASGLAKGKIIIECYATTSAQRRTAILAVQDALNGLAHTAIDDFEIRSLALTNTDCTTESFQDDNGSDEYVYLAAMHFSIWFNESIPTTP